MVAAMLMTRQVSEGIRKCSTFLLFTITLCVYHTGIGMTNREYLVNEGMIYITTTVRHVHTQMMISLNLSIARYCQEVARKKSGESDNENLQPAQQTMDRQLHE